jgi:hypothetical protein
LRRSRCVYTVGLCGILSPPAALGRITDVPYHTQTNSCASIGPPNICSFLWSGSRERWRSITASRGDLRGWTWW